MSPAARALSYIGRGYPQLALWAIGMSSASPTDRANHFNSVMQKSVDCQVL
jgi:hypothetical protein